VVATSTSWSTREPTVASGTPIRVARQQRQVTSRFYSGRVPTVVSGMRRAAKMRRGTGIARCYNGRARPGVSGVVLANASASRRRVVDT
jgi:hypothetical protein